MFGEHFDMCPIQNYMPWIMGGMKVVTVSQFRFFKYAIFTQFSMFKNSVIYNGLDIFGDHWALENGSLDSMYHPISTDYENYALMYGCNDYLLFHTYYAELLSRTDNLP